jgi:pimeloyl-ACP methyl ester carboxylesterase
MDAKDVKQEPQNVADASPPRRRMLGRRIGRVLLLLAALLLLLLVVGSTYQAIATAVDMRRYPPPGQMVDVGGRRLHYRDMGEGDIPVILEAGSGGWSLHWSRVQPAIAEFARVIAYDRAGAGWSDPSDAIPDSASIARDLHEMLQRAEIAGPYVLVGHSAGGFHVRAFAHEYPEEVAGMVLVDPSCEERLADMPDAVKRANAAAAVRQSRWRSMLARIGVVRIYAALTPPERLSAENGKLPEVDRAAELALGQLPKCLMANARESAGFPESARLVSTFEDKASYPLRVLTAERDGPQTAQMQQRLQMHARQAQLSSRGRHVTVPSSGHFIMLDQPDAVVAAIRDVVKEAERQRAK